MEGLLIRHSSASRYAFFSESESVYLGPVRETLTQVLSSLPTTTTPRKSHYHPRRITGEAQESASCGSWLTGSANAALAARTVNATEVRMGSIVSEEEHLPLVSDHIDNYILR